tara:strand:+ start:3105 stop:6284 length:3180 start_codon:yes stop_codon:yes gene_type:complete
MLNIIGNIILSATSAVATVVSQVVLENLRFWLPFERTEKQDKELVTNVDFSSEGNWIYRGSQGYSISNGTLNYDGSSGQFRRALQNLNTKTGAQYELTITIDSISTGSLNFGFGSKNVGSFSGTVQQSFSSVGTHKRIVTATSDEHSIVIQNNVAAQTWSISHVSVKEITQVVPDASRGLTENVGSELNDGTWNPNGGWSVSNGVATNDGTGSTLTNDILTIGKVYRMTVKFSSYTPLTPPALGDFSMFLGVNSESFNFNGTEEFTFTAQCTGDTNARIKSKNGGIGSINISDISIKELTYSDIGPIKNPATLFTGKALNFDGVNDQVYNTSSFPINISSGSWTVAVWFNVDELQDGNQNPINQCIFNNGIDVDNRFGIGIKNKILVVNKYDTTNSYVNVRPIKSGVATLIKQTWQRIVAVIVDGDITVYLDGQPGQESTGTSPYRYFEGFAIGATGSVANPRYFGGKIADVQVYNAAWTAEDALYDYQNPNHLVLDNPNTNILPNNLRGYFPLNEGSGSLAINSGYNEELSIVDENLTNTFENHQNRFNLTIVPNLIVVGPDTQNNQFRIAKKKSTAPSLDVGEKYLISFKYTVNGGGSIEFKTDNAEISLTPTSDATNKTINEVIIESGSGNYNFTFGPTTSAIVGDIEIKNVVDRDTEIDGAVYNNSQSMIPQLGMMDYTYNAENLILHNEDISNVVFGKAGNPTVSEYIKDLPPGVSQAWKVSTPQPSNTYIAINEADNLSVSANGKAKGIWAKTVSGSGKVALNVFHGYFTGSTLQYLPVVTNEWQFFQVQFTNSNPHYYAVDFRHPDNELSEVIIAGAHMTSTDAGTNILKPYIRATSSHPSGASIIQDPKYKGKDSFDNSIRLREHSFNLDGTGYALVAESTSLNIGSGPFTLEAWVKADFINTGSSVNVIWVLDGSESVTAGGNVGLVTFSSNKLGAYVSGVTIDSLTTFVKGQWYHVAIGRTPSGVSSLYINGDLAAIPTSPSAVSLNTAQPKIGIDNTSTRHYKQLIDDVRLYNRLLTTDEIEQNYLAGLDTHTIGSSFSDDFSSDYGN